MKRKMIATAVVFTLWSVLLAPCALAYIDASGTSLLLNAIIGVFIAGGAAVAVYWHKIKRWFRKKRKAQLKARKAAELTAMTQAGSTIPQSADASDTNDAAQPPLSQSM